MIEAADVVAGVVGTGIGLFVATKHNVKQLPPWSDMRLVKFAGERPDNYVEIRDTGRSSLVGRLWFGRDYRYVVRHYREAEIVEDVRYRDPYDALERHAKIAKTL